MINTIATPVSALLLVANATALVTATPKNITSVNLNAGTWLLTGSANFIAAATTTITSLQIGFSTVANTLPTADAGLTLFTLNFATGAASDSIPAIPTILVVGQQGATIFLVGQAAFGTSTMTASGNITAVQVAP
jgi:hypothetical protein